MAQSRPEYDAAYINMLARAVAITTHANQDNTRIPPPIIPRQPPKITDHMSTTGMEERARVSWAFSAELAKDETGTPHAIMLKRLGPGDAHM